MRKRGNQQYVYWMITLLVVTGTTGHDEVVPDPTAAKLRTTMLNRRTVGVPLRITVVAKDEALTTTVPALVILLFGQIVQSPVL